MSAVYDKTKEAFLGGDLALDTADLRAILIDTADYTFSAAHDFLDDVPGAARVAVSATLTGVSITNGVFDAADVTLTSVTGDPSEAVIIYDHTGAADTARRLVAYIDSFSAGMPVTPNGGNITVAWDNGTNKIFKLT